MWRENLLCVFPSVKPAHLKLPSKKKYQQIAAEDKRLEVGRLVYISSLLLGCPIFKANMLVSGNVVPTQQGTPL